jgi:hypothetical protein
MEIIENNLLQIIFSIIGSHRCARLLPEVDLAVREECTCISVVHAASFSVSYRDSHAVLSATIIASSTNCSYGRRTNERDREKLNTCDALEQQRRWYHKHRRNKSWRHQSGRTVCAGVNDSTTYLPIPQLIYRFHDSNCRNH